MGFGAGHISAMLSSLKNNTRRKKRGLKAKPDAPIKKKTEYNFPKVDSRKRKQVVQALLDRRKRYRVVFWMVVVFVFVLGILGSLFIVTWIFEQRS